MYPSIVYPAHNEESRIGKVLFEHHKYFTKHYGNQFEMIVVIDGCIDGTARVVENLTKQIPLSILYFTEASGKVGAVVEGFKHAKGDIVAFCDTDGFLAPHNLHQLVLAVQNGEADCAIGSRFISGSRLIDDGEIVDPNDLIKRNRMTNFFSRLFYVLKERDIECGAKALSGEARDAWLDEMTAEHIYFDAEMLFILKKHGFKVIELPIEWTFVDKEHLAGIRRNTLQCVLNFASHAVGISRMLF